MLTETHNHKTVKRAIWLSYDLGIQGDYESLYQWLDGLDAIECGDNVAFFNLESDGSPIPDQVEKQLETVVKRDSKARIYIIWSDGKKTKGRFIFGRRKSPLWSGYAPKPVTEEHG